MSVLRKWSRLRIFAQSALRLIHLNHLANQSNRHYDGPVQVRAADISLQTYPAEILRLKAKAIDPSKEVSEIAARMFEIMREFKGIGLAAPQVGLSWRMFVANVHPHPDDEEDEKDSSDDYEGLPVYSTGPKVYINPVISMPAGEVEDYEEGCLSLPDIRGKVFRPPMVTITAFDEHGKKFQERGGGLLARCWQHEFDHLDGVLILDRMTQISRLKNRSAVRDLEKAANKR